MKTAPIKAIPYHVMWTHADKGRIREDLAIIADRGLTHIVLSPAWFRLQPRPYQIDRVVMATLEACYDAAAHVGLQSITSILTAGYAGVRELPDWHHSADVVGWLQGRTTAPLYGSGGTIRINGVSRRMQFAHPYTTDTYRAGQRELVRVVMGYFAGHSAAQHWLLAPGWGYLADVQPTVATSWWQALTSLARRVNPQAVLMAQIDGPQMVGHGLDVGMVAREVDVVVVDTAMPVLAQRQMRPVFAPMQFLHAVVAGLAQRPTVIGMYPIGVNDTSTWHTVRWYDRPVAVPVCAHGQIATIWHDFVTYMQRMQVAGVVYPVGWHAGHDDDRHDQIAQRFRVTTAIHADCELALRDWRVVGANHDDIDSERYRYRPRQELARLWRAFATDS